MLTHSILRRNLTALAGGVASVLAAIAIAIASPASAAVDYFHSGTGTTPTATSWSWGADQVGLNVTQAGQDVSFHFTRPGD